MAPRAKPLKREMHGIHGWNAELMRPVFPATLDHGENQDRCKTGDDGIMLCNRLRPAEEQDEAMCESGGRDKGELLTRTDTGHRGNPRGFR